jgi:MazG family protein
MAQLRSQDSGCPWDVEQSFDTIAPYTIEEAYEVADAIARNDMADLKDELGDLLFQVVFHGRMAEERGLFGFSDIADHCSDKMIRRHPHVFGEGAVVGTAAEQTRAWEEIKARERTRSTAEEPGALDGVPVALPALTRAVKIQKRAARVGFDWKTVPPILDKIDEELAELRAVLAGNATIERVEEELGDLIFAVANLARRLDLDAETVLGRATRKFERRFRVMEALAKAAGATLSELDDDRLETLWSDVKRHEKQTIES